MSVAVCMSKREETVYVCVWKGTRETFMMLTAAAMTETPQLARLHQP